jgi:hypothetical protein
MFVTREIPERDKKARNVYFNQLSNDIPSGTLGFFPEARDPVSCRLPQITTLPAGTRVRS